MKPDELRWNGWGAEDRGRPLSAAERSWLAELLGIATWAETPAPPIDEVTLPASTLSAEALAALRVAVGPAQVRTDRRDRVYHALGQSYHDLLRYRSGQLSAAPDAVAYPESETQVGAVLGWAEAHRAAVIPFGGGSSVVGGVTATSHGAFPHVVTLDTTRMNRLIAVEETARLATFEAGVDGPTIERRLAERGYTLGHYPQSFEYSTLGGWIAARGAGQQSNRYGAADHWLASARLITPTGPWATEPYPASAAGPRLADLVAGSEGTLGVITQATVHIHPRPERRWEHGFLFRDFEAGLAAVQSLSQADLGCSMLRLSDPDETKFQGGFAGLGRKRGLAERLFRRWLARRGYADRPALLLAGVEGDASRVRHDARALTAIARAHGAQRLGAAPGRAWRAHRFDAPFLRDPLLDLGLGVDTLETATRWHRLPGLHATTRRAIETALAGAGVVMAHVSHTYPDGASLYFTFVFQRELDDPIGQWRRIKDAASEAIIANGGTISHHHGVGEDHLPWLERDKGALALRVLRETRLALDPDGRLNPGKLV